MWTNTSQHIKTMYSSHKYFRKLHLKNPAGFTKESDIKDKSNIFSCRYSYMGPLDFTSFNFACLGCHCWYGVPILHHPRKMLKNRAKKGIKDHMCWAWFWTFWSLVWYEGAQKSIGNNRDEGFFLETIDSPNSQHFVWIEMAFSIGNPLDKMW